MRINVLPVEIPTDQHLRAEYLETFGMILPFYRRTMKSKKVLQHGFNESDIPKEYILSTGHATFFYNKFGYAQKRYNDVVNECKRRGFKTTNEFLYISEIPLKHQNGYIPTKQALKDNTERIIMRINKKISWYRYEGKRIDESFLDQYKEYLDV